MAGRPSSSTASSTGQGLTSIALLIFIFVATGVSAPMLLNYLQYLGGVNASTMLYLAPLYIGGLGVAMFPIQTLRPSMPPKLTFAECRSGLTMALIDVASQGLCYGGLLICGAGVYTIMYASVTAWTAILSRVLLSRKLTMAQWGAVVLATAGLGITAMDKSGASESEVSSTFMGGAMVLAGASLNGLTYVLSEKLLNTPGSTLNGQKLGFMVGLVGTVIIGTWTVFYTLPRFHELVVAPMVDGAGLKILLCYVLLTLSHWSHLATWYLLLGSLGSVATGVMKGIQSVSVFVGSHLCFCRVFADHKQCITDSKLTSLVVVCSGVLWYAKASMNAAAEIKLQEASKRDGSPVKDAVSPSTKPRE